jgi:hypothetical protein
MRRCTGQSITLPMPFRILSFLSEIENALQSEAPAHTLGPWSNGRIINYQSGLARLSLGVKADATAPLRPLGSILLQAFDLADHSFCLKANISWTEKDAGSEIVHAIYDKPGVDWVGEARQIAAKWLAGPPAEKFEDAQEPIAVAG